MIPCFSQAEVNEVPLQYTPKYLRSEAIFTDSTKSKDEEGFPTTP